ncbi:hypothetical protein PsorP6_016822 [Peronosclerospora sorghi]|uniref:Uncharacterized protein n=1 Tax=Peronosclerospora sorghi TaxID=230839 RepID=A0ACC0WCI4_9STRA|nr:hypothetical protein PsorP6_016822 [Peronosclerospora sorghi]
MSISEPHAAKVQELCFTLALGLQLTHNIITNAWKVYEKDEWESAAKKELTVANVVADCLPLHDRAFNRQFFDEYRNRTLGKWGLLYAAAGNSERWAVEELRLHFGERVAFLFAFMHIYTKNLMPLTLACLMYYLTFRFMSSEPVWRQYMQGLALLGLGVVGARRFSCAGPEKRACSWKSGTWPIRLGQEPRDARDGNDPEAAAAPVDPAHDARVRARVRRHSVSLPRALYQVVRLRQERTHMRRVQWRHDDAYPCKWFITFFNASTSALGKERWIYILIQGILLGLLIFFKLFNWMSEKYVQWENYARKSEHENR